MQRHNHKDSFVIRVLETNVNNNNNINNSTVSPKLNLSTMKIFNRFRKLLMRLIFSLPSSTRSSSASAMQRNSDRFEPPKTSCSSYYSSHSHYNEAIADCIEFFNKSSQDHAICDDEARRKSDVMV